MGDNIAPLRLATYMCPSIAVEFYELLADYFEEKLNIKTILVYDSRHKGPDVSRGDQNLVDLAFVTTSEYLEEFIHDPTYFWHLPIGTVTKHPTKGETLGYYTDVVVHRDVMDRTKDFLDLRGSSFVYTSDHSLSSSKQTLMMLKQMGENSTFFSDIKASGNHANSVETVVAKRAEVTAVDSLALSHYLMKHYYQADEVVLLESWGPHPPHPILINRKVPDDFRHKLEATLLSMHDDLRWAELLAEFSILRFEQTSDDIYVGAMDLLELASSLSMEVPFY